MNVAQLILFSLIGLSITVPAYFGSNYFIRLKNRKFQYENARGTFPFLSKSTLFMGVTLVLLWTAAGLFPSELIASIFIGVLGTIAILISIIDLRIRIIPNESLLMLGFLGLVYQWYTYGLGSLFLSFLTMLGLMALFLIVSLFTGRKAVGAGDVKLAGAMGFVLGYPNILYGMLAMGALLVLVSFVGFHSYRITMKTMVPYAPFMMFGMITSLFAMSTGLLT